jgi:hypothetical protein
MAVKHEILMKSSPQFLRLMLALVMGLTLFVATSQEGFGCCSPGLLASNAASVQSASAFSNSSCCSSEAQSCCCSDSATPHIGVVAISGCQTQSIFTPQRGTTETTRLPDLALRTVSAFDASAGKQPLPYLAKRQDKEPIYILNRRLLI